MASEGEEMDMTPVESEVSATETDTEAEDCSVESDAESIEVETVPISTEEAEMEELLGQLEDYTPTVPDALTMRILHSSGFASVDPRIVRIISVSAQKFISDIANDALQHCKTRTTNIQHSSGHSSNKDKKNPKDRKYTLAMEDLVPALADHGITMRKPQYFV
ncbi:transcription initiation factor TFIID subunit 10 [Drosophila grimshawi]|uniref:Transcription initiation factor TFIID subunit 10 n=1 Tax=Drosophila grimshawi TaxID=7222 RepID=B4JD01_DROGR|nr:transcription initiation factor TFIID subunit 10 [Drosophila grimshawi]EDW04245.1 GH11693 [Drosophila grimshawi]